MKGTVKATKQNKKDTAKTAPVRNKKSPKKQASKAPKKKLFHDDSSEDDECKREVVVKKEGAKTACIPKKKGKTKELLEKEASEDDDSEKLNFAEKENTKHLLKDEILSFDDDKKMPPIPRKKACRNSLVVQVNSDSTNSSIHTDSSGEKRRKNAKKGIRTVANKKTVSMVTPPRTIETFGVRSSGGRSMVARDLNSFGLRASSNSLFNASQFGPRDSLLRCVLIKNETNYTIVFRCELCQTNPRGTSWSDKLLNDAVTLRHPWAQALGFLPKSKPWYHDDVLQNQPGTTFAMRLYLICVESATDRQILDMAHYICDQINSMPTNSTKLWADEANFFWLTYPVRWSSVIGTEECMRWIIAEKGLPHVGFVREHREFLTAFFDLNTLTPEMAVRLQVI